MTTQTTSPTPTIARVVLFLNSLAFCVIGVWFFVDPGVLATVDVSTTSAQGLTEIRAVYGGMEIGLGLFGFWSLRDPARWPVAIAGIGMAFAGMAIGRAAGMAIDAAFTPQMMMALTLENVAMIASVVAYRSVVHGPAAAE